MASPGPTPTSCMAPRCHQPRLPAARPRRVTDQAERHIFGYHLLVRRAVTELVEAELGQPRRRPRTASEGIGLLARALDEIRQPRRPLSEIAACWGSQERR